MVGERSPVDDAPRIVEAVFTSANTGEIAGGGGKSLLAKMIEMAMSEAVQFAYSNGIADPEKIRELMQLARSEVKKRYAEAVEKAMAGMT
jgi:hypothetical protein